MSALVARHPGSGRVRSADLVLGVVLTAAFQLEIWLVGGRLPGRPAVALLSLGMTVPFVFFRRAPLACAAVIALSWVVVLRLTGVEANRYITVVVVLVVAAYLAGYHPHPARGALAGAAILVGTCQELITDADSDVADYVFIALIIGAAWTAGWAVRQREHRAARLVDEAVVLRGERDRAAEDAADHERARIARELHDIISHSVSVMVLQAGAAGEVMPTNPAQAKRSLDAVQLTGREALVELRHLLGVLGDVPGLDSKCPQPGVGQLSTVLETMRGTGMAIDLEVQGMARDLPPGVDISAFRIVQEALTNCARHAGPADVQVILTYAEDGLGIQVRDTGGTTARPVQPGRGLVGMRERVALHSGHLEAGPDPAGGFVVRAWLPLREGVE